MCLAFQLISEASAVRELNLLKFIKSTDGGFTGHVALLRLTTPLSMRICLRLYLSQQYKEEVAKLKRQ